MKTSTKLSIALSAALCLASSASAVTTLFVDDFDGDNSSLNGRTPNTTTDSATWNFRTDEVTPSTQYQRNGTVTTGGRFGAYLEFAPEANKIYTLKGDVSTDFDSGSTEWIGFGWVDDATSTGTTSWHAEGQRGYAWGLLRENGDSYIRMKNTDETSTQTGTGNSAAFEIILDTTNISDVRASVTITGSSKTNSAMNQSLGTLAGIAIQGFGFSSNSLASGSIGNLSLTVIPEPQSFALLAACCAFASVALRRRRRA